MRIKSMRHAREIVRCCFCPQCGKKRIPTDSGAVCMEHKVQLMPPGWFAKLDEATEMLELPLVQAVKGLKRRCRFTIDGLPGTYRARRDGPVRAVDTFPRPRIRTYTLLKNSQ